MGSLEKANFIKLRLHCLALCASEAGSYGKSGMSRPTHKFRRNWIERGMRIGIDLGILVMGIVRMAHSQRRYWSLHAQYMTEIL